MTTYSTADVVFWLDGIASGVIDLTNDNCGLAAAALGLMKPPEPAPPLPEGFLSPHFTLDELIYSDNANACGIDNTPDQAAINQLEALANETLEGIRTLCGNNAVFISSGFRCAELNAAVGGASNSAHLYGCAADFTIPGFGSVDRVCDRLKDHLEELEIDQLINESGGGANWVHVGRAIPPSTTPRYEIMTIENGETIMGVV